MAIQRRIVTAIAGSALALGLGMAAPAMASANSPARDLPGATPAHMVLIPYCEESSLPFFGPIIICHTLFGDLTFSRPW
ncbi:hypothetical protein IEU95_09255 [Hoyosella rhizosphaerae]|uniref:Uncharacterized protein n=1 Tax=Hoyosella rhizosphaerae TaxID=1755582 RepID=A0A916U2N4_9ACTN|nr:hypothetical protein [Hoyosella rhizosphaerae]MBN4927019.1 hypothetical protein [Hoyosella rhizosphaerae]GGC54688.1 hypothetical protein GCM10011410_03830 [Hoyosella rhizosphaerae]